LNYRYNIVASQRWLLQSVAPKRTANADQMLTRKADRWSHFVVAQMLTSADQPNRPTVMLLTNADQGG
jgi:hypothetical protein